MGQALMAHLDPLLYQTPVLDVSFTNLKAFFGSEVSLRVHYCKRDEVYFTTLLWQNNVWKNGFISCMLFSYVYKIMVKKVTFVGFMGERSPQSLHPGSAHVSNTGMGRFVYKHENVFLKIFRWQMRVWFVITRIGTVLELNIKSNILHSTLQLRPF